MPTSASGSGPTARSRREPCATQRIRDHTVKLAWVALAFRATHPAPPMSSWPGWLTRGGRVAQDGLRVAVSL